MELTQKTFSSVLITNPLGLPVKWSIVIPYSANFLLIVWSLFPIDTYPSLRDNSLIEMHCITISSNYSFVNLSKYDIIISPVLEIFLKFGLACTEPLSRWLITPTLPKAAVGGFEPPNTGVWS